MPRRVILSSHEKASLLALPESQDELIRYYTFNETDLALIRQRRGDANRLGFAVQLCLLRFPGCALTGETNVTDPVIYWAAGQIKADAGVWPNYAERDETRREHFQELRAYLGLSTFKLNDYRNSIQKLTELALQTDNSMVLATQGVELLRQRSVILPPLAVIERICAEAITRANRRIYRELNVPLTFSHQQRLDELLKTKPGSGITWLTWLRQSIKIGF